MRLVDAVGLSGHAHPYVITLAPDRNVRWPIGLSNEAAPAARRHAHAFHAPGSLDAAGRMTETGRRTVLDGMRRKARNSTANYCIVWGEGACTFLMPDGSAIDGRSVPHAKPVCPEDYEAVNAWLVGVDWIALPEECDCSHLCIRTLSIDRVEISSGAPMTLGYFDELPSEGPGSALGRHLDRAGRIVPPATFRGAPVTGVAHGTVLLGPVQPDGRMFRVVQPWPTEVFAACREVAGRSLPEDLLVRAWHAVDPLRTGFLRGGVREAA